MKFAHSIKQKSKIAIFLFGIMVCTILIRFLEDKIVKDMNAAFISMYNDRLIPATDLFYLAENLYAKRYILESIIEDGPEAGRHKALLQRLRHHEDNINSLLLKYEKTFLTPLEKKHFEELKVQLKANHFLEEQFIKNQSTLTSKELKTQFETIGNASFDEIAKTLTNLTNIQTSVGEELIKDSNYLVSGSNLYSNIQIFLAVLIGVLIVGIVFTSNAVKVVQKKYDLN